MASTMRVIVEGTAARSIADLGMKVVSFVSYFLIIHALSVSDYGVVVLLLSFVAPFGAISTLGLSRLFVADVAVLRRDGDASKIKGMIVGYFKFIFSIAAIFIIIVFLSRNFVAKFYSAHIANFFWPVALIVLSQLFLNFVLMIFESFERFKILSSVQFVEAFFKTVGIIVLFFLGQISIFSVVFTHFFAKLAATLISVPYLNKFLRPVFSMALAQTSNIFYTTLKTYGKWNICNSILNRVVNSARLWILGFLVGVSGVAVFDFAFKFNSFVNNILPLRAVLFPVVSRAAKDKELVTLIISKAKKYLLLAYISAFVASLFVIPIIINKFFTPYSPWTFVVIIAMLHLFVDVVSIGQAPLLYAFQKQKFIFISATISYLFQILLDIGLILTFGVLGLVLSAHIYVVGIAAVREYYLRRFLNIRTWNTRAFLTFDNYDKLIFEKIKRHIMV